MLKEPPQGRDEMAGGAGGPGEDHNSEIKMFPSFKHKLAVLVAAVLVIAGVIVLSGGLKGKSAPPAPPPPAVEVFKAEQRDVPTYGEWIGTLDGLVNADVKAQVQGYLLTKNYIEGAFVKKGQLLFQIDPRPFQATVEQAKAQLAQAQGQLGQVKAQLSQAQAQLAQADANQKKTQLDVDRYVPLAKEKAVTQQDLDNAIQANEAAKAQVRAAAAAIETSSAAIAAGKATVQAAEAAVRSAELNLNFTKILSPIDGIAGIAQGQVGDLVNPSSTALTTVSTVDPIKVYFTLSEQEYLAFIQRHPTSKERNAAERESELELILADGTTYPKSGKFFAEDRNVDQRTGSIRLAAVFPNPDGLLRPGQYGRVREVTSIEKGAVVVPQRAITEMQGTYQLDVVGNDNRVTIRPVKVGARVGNMWVIEGGLRPGEGVIAEGLQEVRKSGDMVTPKPFHEPSPPSR